MTTLLLWLTLLPSQAGDRLSCAEVREWFEYQDLAESTLIDRLARYSRYQKGLVDCVQPFASAGFVEALEARIEGRTATAAVRHLLDVRRGDAGEQIGGLLAERVRAVWPGPSGLVLVWTDDTQAMPEWAYDVRQQISAATLAKLTAHSVDIGTYKQLGVVSDAQLSADQRAFLQTKGHDAVLFLARDRGERDALELVFKGYVEELGSRKTYPVRLAIAPTAEARIDLPTGRVVRVALDRTTLSGPAGTPVSLLASLTQADGKRVVDVREVWLDGQRIAPGIDLARLELRLLFPMPELPAGPQQRVLTVIMADGTRARTLLTLSNTAGATLSASTPGLRRGAVHRSSRRTASPAGLVLRQGWWGVSAGAGASGFLPGTSATARPDTRVPSEDADATDIAEAERATAYNEVSVPLDDILPGNAQLSGLLGMQARLSAIRVQLDLQVGALVPGAQFQTSQAQGAINGQVGLSVHYGAFLGLGYGVAPASFFLGWRVGGNTLSGRGTATSGADPGEMDLRINPGLTHGPQLLIDLFADNYHDGTSRQTFAMGIDVRALVFGSLPQVGANLYLQVVFGR